MKLLANALIKFTCGLLLVGLLIFLPAGTLRYTYGWLFAGLLFVPMLIAGFVMYFKNPAFLEKRLDAKEKQATQKGVLAFAGLMFIVGFVVAGLDFRFGWSQMPGWVVVAASVLFLIAYALYAEVMRENAYLSRTVKVEEGQSVVDTGHRPPSHVCGDSFVVSDDPSDPWLLVCLDRLCFLSCDHCCEIKG